MLRYLLDTHVLVWRITEQSRLSREQTRVLDQLETRNEAFAISGVTLLEIALLHGRAHKRTTAEILPLLSLVGSNPLCSILPVTLDIAVEVAVVGDSLRDPGDRAIVATARIHNLRLITSDQRIIASGLVPVID